LLAFDSRVLQLRRFLVVAWFLILIWGAILPGQPHDPSSLFGLPADKVVHLLVFGFWGVLIFMVPVRWKIWLPVAMVLALGQESLQLWVPERSFEWMDWAADCLGLTLACLGCACFRPLLPTFSASAS